MQAARIKRGASFKATITFDADEWAELHPWTSVEASVGQGSRRFPKRYPLAVAVSAANRTLTLTAETGDWEIGPASFDVWIAKDGKKQPVPASHNVMLSIIEGVVR